MAERQRAIDELELKLRECELKNQVLMEGEEKHAERDRQLRAEMDKMA